MKTYNSYDESFESYGADFVLPNLGQGQYTLFCEKTFENSSKTSSVIVKGERLKGATSFSALEETLDDNQKWFELYPNPVIGDVTVDFSLCDEETVVVRILNLHGEVLLKEVLRDFEDNKERSYDISHLADGIYIVSIEANGLIYTRKLIKK